MHFALSPITWIKFHDRKPGHGRTGTSGVKVHLRGSLTQFGSFKLKVRSTRLTEHELRFSLRPPFHPRLIRSLKMKRLPLDLRRSFPIAPLRSGPWTQPNRSNNCVHPLSSMCAEFGRNRTWKIGSSSGTKKCNLDKQTWIQGISGNKSEVENLYKITMENLIHTTSTLHNLYSYQILHRVLWMNRTN